MTERARRGRASCYRLRAALAATRAVSEDRRRHIMVLTAERDLALARLRLRELRARIDDAGGD